MRGVTVTLYKRTATGTSDNFGRPLYTETAVSVDNVLIAPVSTQEVTETMSLTGKRAVYNLAIPKGDSNDWEDVRVSFWGTDFRTIGKPLAGIEDLIPLDWNKKVQVEHVEEG